MNNSVLSALTRKQMLQLESFTEVWSIGLRYRSLLLLCLHPAPDFHGARVTCFQTLQVKHVLVGCVVWETGHLVERVVLVEKGRLKFKIHGTHVRGFPGSAWPFTLGNP